MDGVLRSVHVPAPLEARNTTSNPRHAGAYSSSGTAYTSASSPRVTTSRVSHPPLHAGRTQATPYATVARTPTRIIQTSGSSVTAAGTSSTNAILPSSTTSLSTQRSQAAPSSSARVLSHTASLHPTQADSSRSTARSATNETSSTAQVPTIPSAPQPLTSATSANTVAMPPSPPGLPPTVRLANPDTVASMFGRPAQMSLTDSATPVVASTRSSARETLLDLSTLVLSVLRQRIRTAWSTPLRPTSSCSAPSRSPFAPAGSSADNRPYLHQVILGLYCTYAALRCTGNSAVDDF
ncbi:hypothetical protein BD626DRAFT_241177 [Schizophyllum amplum]|uniref:Uncharacterized protein n=1 Tax=Schizophyllum amplum TaxID=97359 RepID=A0A550CJY5_9AGAR|nr:hypothetical protein BD626DRAFT_241177 [Auriculariopsis ampla]